MALVQVFAVYQALPGPEATEIASYFGLVSKGKLGGLLTGLGFILPGEAAPRCPPVFRCLRAAPP
jgi:chromate transport protein ChrA